MAHQIETRKLDDRQIILHYFFEPIQVPVSFSDDSILTADKWLSIRDWVWINTRINSMVELYQIQEGSISNTTDEELNDTSLRCCFSWKDVGSSTFGRSCKDLLKLRSSHTVNHYISVRISQSKISKISKQIKTLKQEFAAAKELQNPTKVNTTVDAETSGPIADDEVIPETPENSSKLNGPICKTKIKSTIRFPSSAEKIVVGMISLGADTVIPKEGSNCDTDKDTTVHTETKIRAEKLSSKGIPVELPNRMYRERLNTRLIEAQEEAEYIPVSVSPAKHDEYSPGNSEHQLSQEEYTPTHSTPPEKINPVYTPSSSGSNIKFHDKYVPSAPVYTPSRRKRYAISGNTDEYDPTTPGPATQRTKRSKIISTTDMTSNRGIQALEWPIDKQSHADSNHSDPPVPKVATNLFGESDEEIAAVRNTYPREKLLRRVKTSQNLKDDNLKKERPAAKDSGWLSKPSVDKEKRTSSHPRTKSIDQLSGSRSTKATTDVTKSTNIEDVNRKDKVTEQAIAALKEFNKKMRAEALPDIEILDLKKVSNDELKLHFNDSCKEFLFPHFEKYCKQSEYRPTRSLDLPVYIMNYLLTDQQQLEMMNILQEYFSSEKTNYDELFWEVMMPEWSVALFMSSFKMNRKEAIDRIELQIKVSEASLYLEDLYKI